MNPYVNEEVMWQRLMDRQREADNRRAYGTQPSFAIAFGDAGIVFGRMVEGLFGRFTRRRGWTDVLVDESDAASDIA